MAGFFDSISKKYEELWKNIVQPPRQQYALDNMGPEVRILHGVTVRRRNFSIKNSQNDQLECSLFHVSENNQEMESQSVRARPLAIYLHGSSGCRLEAMTALPWLTPEVNLLSFDFSGSGKSGGQYVTMGSQECEDLVAVVAHVQAELKPPSLILWGRSMGAVTALLYASRMSASHRDTLPVLAIVLDSPYSNLSAVLAEIAAVRTSVPQFIVEGVIALLKGKVIEAVKRDIFAVDIEKEVESIENIPAAFCYATQDSVIKPYHTKRLHDLYQGRKELISFEGTHNVVRPNILLARIHDFLMNAVASQQQKKRFVLPIRDRQSDVVIGADEIRGDGGNFDRYLADTVTTFEQMSTAASHRGVQHQPLPPKPSHKREQQTFKNRRRPIFEGLEEEMFATRVKQGQMSFHEPVSRATAVTHTTAHVSPDRQRKQIQPCGEIMLSAGAGGDGERLLQTEQAPQNSNLSLAHYLLQEIQEGVQSHRQHSTYQRNSNNNVQKQTGKIAQISLVQRNSNSFLQSKERFVDEAPSANGQTSHGIAIHNIASTDQNYKNYNILSENYRKVQSQKTQSPVQRAPLVNSSLNSVNVITIQQSSPPPTHPLQRLRQNQPQVQNFQSVQLSKQQSISLTQLAYNRQY